MNFQLNSPQSPFFTYLTVIVPNNGSHSVTVAADLRDTNKRERSKILGVAVMLPAPTFPKNILPIREEIVGKCWLVPISKQAENE